MTYLVALGNFPHVVAESVEVLDLVLSHRVPWNALFAKFRRPPSSATRLEASCWWDSSITPR